MTQPHRYWLNLGFTVFKTSLSLRGLMSPTSRRWRMAHADGRQIKTITRELMPLFIQCSHGVAGWGIYVQVWPLRIEIEYTRTQEATKAKMDRLLGRTPDEAAPNVVPFNRR